MSTMNTDETKGFIERKAIDTNGRIGRFYDAINDCVMEESLNIPQFDSQHWATVEKCELSKQDYETSTTFSKILHLDSDLSLSVALKLINDQRMSALLNEHHLTNENTRVIQFSLTKYREQVPNDQLHQRIKNKEMYRSELKGTHVIVSIDYGVDLVIIFNSPSDRKSSKKLDEFLEQISEKFEFLSSFKDRSEEVQLLKNITNMKIYSNVLSFFSCRSLENILDTLQMIRDAGVPVLPMKYKLCPIGDLFNSRKGQLFQPYHRIKSEDAQMIRDYIASLEKDRHSSLLLINQRLQELRKQVRMFRQGMNSADWCIRFLARQKELNCDLKVDTNVDQTKAAIEKNQFNDEDCFLPDAEYMDIGIFGFEQNESLDELKENLLKQHRDRIVFCYTDEIRQKYLNEWMNAHAEIKRLLITRFDIKIVYADFTRSSMKNRIRSLIIWGLKECKEYLNVNSSKSYESDPVINILLLGESGVGKSTLINSLVNHLKYRTFQDALDQKPIVILPVSFMLCTGHDFKEHQIKDEGLDKSNNEQLVKTTQSVTQSCRSYLITLPDEKYRRKKIRFIDTPGFNDTRGSETDDSNLQEIVSFIECFDHLDYICLLLKPDVARLTIQFRNAVRSLFELMGDKMMNHLLFCYTNTRTTFYAPGSSKSILSEYLREFHQVDNVFMKERTFCFESETFRYFLARYQHIPFDQEDEEQVKDSWKHSERESSRFFKYLCRSNHPIFHMTQRKPTEMGIRSQISSLVPLILTSVINILRNHLQTVDSITFVSHIQNGGTRVQPVKPLELMISSLALFSCFLERKSIDKKDWILEELNQMKTQKAQLGDRLLQVIEIYNRERRRICEDEQRNFFDRTCEMMNQLKEEKSIREQWGKLESTRKRTIEEKCFTLDPLVLNNK